MKEEIDDGPDCPVVAIVVIIFVVLDVIRCARSIGIAVIHEWLYFSKFVRVDVKLQQKIGTVAPDIGGIGVAVGASSSRNAKPKALLQ